MRTLPRYKLTPDLEDEEVIQLQHGCQDEIVVNTRHRLGGQPDFIDDEDFPCCQFGKPMTFYAQLDSVSETFMLADRGMIYVFVCFNCFETKAVLQSY